MTAATPFAVWRAAVTTAIRNEIDGQDDERWEALMTAYRGIRRTEEGRRMIQDWIGRKVRVSPRDGYLVMGVLAGVDEYGLTLRDTRPANPLDAAYNWGVVHIPWRNVASTYLQDSDEGERS